MYCLPPNQMWLVVKFQTYPTPINHIVIYNISFVVLPQPPVLINKGKCAYFYTCNMLTLYNYKGYNQLCMFIIRVFMHR